MSLFAATLFGVAPLGFGLVRWWSTGADTRMLWMAVVASAFAFGVLVTAIGRRRSRHAVLVDASVILVVSTLSAGATGFVLGATAGPGVWMVALVQGACLAASSVLVAFARPTPR
jgi:hypothetical protein